MANDARYLIAFFLLLPLIAGDFLVIKLFAVVSYCMDLVIAENIYIRANGAWQNVTVHEWLYLAVKLFLLFFALEALIVSVLDSEPPQNKGRIILPNV
jgi:hypothetical protein